MTYPILKISKIDRGINFDGRLVGLRLREMLGEVA